MAFNYDFKIKNITKTRRTHKKRIDKVSKVPYSYVLDRLADDWITSNILRSAYWINYFRNKKRKDLTKTQFKNIKMLVNSHTRVIIRKGLEYEGLPKSWDTAFYMAHKTKVDALMKRITRELLRQLR